MDTLPTELLSKIFLECLPGFHEPYPTVSASKPPILFTTINRQWKEIACNSPQLWTRIHIGIHVAENVLHAGQPTSRWRRLENQGQAIIRWFERSAGLNVSVSFEIINLGLGIASSYVRDRTFDELMLPIVDSICVYSKQWQHLKLHTIDEPYRSRILSIGAENFPRLSQFSFKSESARVRRRNKFKELKRLKDSGVIQAPLLSTLCLKALSPEDRLQDLPLANWANLRELHFANGYNTKRRRFLDMASAETLLRRCVNLEVLKLTIQAGASPLAHPSQDIILPHLTFLKLKEFVGDPQDTPLLAPLLSLLKLPALTHLETCAGTQPGFSQEASLMTLINANELTFRNTLTNIDFEYNFLNPNELKECFRVLQALTHMAVTAGSVYPYCEVESISTHPPHFAIFWDLTELTPEPVGQSEAGVIHCLLPKLEHFYVSLQGEEEFEADELVTFVEGRLKYAGRRSHISGEPIAKLKSVYGGFVSEEKIDVHEELGKRGVNLDGVQVEVEYQLECQCDSI